jgi:hypothetical protein
MKEMRDERNQLAKEFSGDELSKKMIVKGVQKICILGVIKYH